MSGKKKSKLPKEDENIAAVATAELAADYLNEFGFKKRKSIKRFIKRPKNRISRRTSKKRSFGISEIPGLSLISSEKSKKNFKLFLIVVIFTILRSLFKKSDINDELIDLQLNTINFLTITSLIGIIQHFVGPTITNKIVLGYLVLTFGVDISNHLI